jgi:predicted negative regulator of RcsB-dependent stress response
LRVWHIVAITVFCALLIAAAIVGFCWWRRRRARRLIEAAAAASQKQDRANRNEKDDLVQLQSESSRMAPTSNMRLLGDGDDLLGPTV